MDYKKKVIIGDATLYLGDSMNILRYIKKVDLIFTDPPYLLTSGGRTPSNQQAMTGKFSNDQYDGKGKIVKCDIDWTDFMPLLYQCLKENADAYIMCNNNHLRSLLNAAEIAGFKEHNILVWDKITATPNRWYMKNVEFTVYLYKGKAVKINDCGSKQLIRVPNPTNTEHPTEKPAALIKCYIENSTTQNETVLDAFMGGGSTGVAAIQAGRKFIGVELDEQYFNLACRRIREAQDQSDLFSRHVIATEGTD